MTNGNKNQTCQLLSANTLGDMLSLSKRQIFRLNSCGKIPAPIRIGGSVRWAQSTIAQWLKRTPRTCKNIIYLKDKKRAAYLFSSGTIQKKEGRPVGFIM